MFGAHCDDRPNNRMKELKNVRFTLNDLWFQNILSIYILSNNCKPTYISQQIELHFTCINDKIFLKNIIIAEQIA